MNKSMKKQKVTFTCNAPGARTVQVAGDFTGWEQSPLNLKPSKSGAWQTTVSLAPGRYAYRLLVDGQWRDDPGCSLREANPFGGQNCIRTVDAV
jgi:chromosome partitioning protein